MTRTTNTIRRVWEARISGLWLLVVGLLPLAAGAVGAQEMQAGGQILVCVAENAPQSLHKAAREMVGKPETVPLLRALLNSGAATGVQAISSEEVLKNLRDDRNYHRAAFNHLLVIGLPQDDPLLQMCMDHTVRLVQEGKEFFATGYGEFSGDIGWLECERNPFAFSQRIADAPATTLFISITGTSENGVLAALTHFRSGLLNAAVAGKNVRRTRESILDGKLDAPPPPLPVLRGCATLPGGLILAGWTQPGEDEYRALPDYNAPEPERLWRLKWLAPGALAGVQLWHWNNSPHRKAFGNAVNIAKFASEQAAQEAFGALAGLRQKDQESTFAGRPALLIPVAEDMRKGGEKADIVIVRQADMLLFSTLPEDAFARFIAALEKPADGK